jgi:membrane dipeptidase
MHPIVDLHCDTIYELAQKQSGCLWENEGHVSLAWMDKAGKVTTCFALFVDSKLGDCWQAAQYLHQRFLLEMLRNHDRIVQVRTADEVCTSARHGAILSCEELQILEGKLERIGTLASWGVRLATLTWNHENDFGFPHHQVGGLKSLGFAAIEEMERNNILVDVSHLNDEGFFDAASIARKPLIASHSNCRTVTNHSRNLSDHMIRVIADKGGVVGLNFCPSFLSENWNTSTVEAMVRHAAHLKQVGGSAVLALGTDYDGITGDIEIPHYDGLILLWQALEKSGFTDSDLEGMWYSNALRVLS